MGPPLLLWSEAGPAPCPIKTHKSFTRCTHQSQLYHVPAEICRRSEPPILHGAALRLTFATAKNVINFLNTAVDLLLRWRGSHERRSSPILRIMECIIASVFTRRAKRETECGRKALSKAIRLMSLWALCAHKKTSIKSRNSLIHCSLLQQLHLREEW